MSVFITGQGHTEIPSTLLLRKKYSQSQRREAPTVSIAKKVYKQALFRRVGRGGTNGLTCI